MALTPPQFDALVARIEPLATRHPTAYKLRVGLLAALGYAYIAGIVALILLVLAGLGYLVVNRHGVYAVIKVAIPVVALLWIVLRALWVRLDPPGGVPLDRDEAPALRQAVDEIRRRLDAPRPHQILISDEYNAAVSQVPRLGVVGWPRSYLVLGLPLLNALTPGQFRAVLAHEFAHLSRAHARFGAWIYRVRRTWFQLVEALERSQHGGAVLFTRFFEWYAPYFGAYSFVLARANEYEADRLAAEVAGREAMAGALVRLDVKGRYLSEAFWPQVFQEARHRPAPPEAVHAPMLVGLRAPVAADEETRWLGESLRAQTGTDDTHPALADRLRALGVPAPDEGDGGAKWLRRELARDAETAADHFLGGAAERFAARLDQAWRAAVEQSWREQYEHVQRSERRLAELDDRAAASSLAAEEEWERVALTAELRDRETALPLLRDLVSREPSHPQAVFVLGRMLIQAGDEEGVALLERDMAADPNAVLPGCGLIASFLEQRGRGEEAARYRERARRHAELLQQAQTERGTVGERDSFLPHALTAQTVRVIQAHLRAHDDIDRAYLVRKAVEHFPERPCYVLAIVRRRVWSPFRRETPDGQLVDELIAHLSLPDDTLVAVISRSGKGRALRAVLERVDRAEILRAGAATTPSAGTRQVGSEASTAGAAGSER